MAINCVTIAGNLCRDGEFRNTPNGSVCLRFTVAVNERRKDASGNWVDAPQFVDCTMWGKRAEAVAKYLRKGCKVAVQGKLHYSAWEDANTGAKRSKLDVTATEIEFMSRRGDSQPAQQQPVQPAQQATAYTTADIPF